MTAEAAGDLGYAWTNDSNAHGRYDLDGNKLLWVKAVARHEFGHTFGLADKVENSPYTGIMNAENVFDRSYGQAVLTIQTVDYDELEQVYKGHTRKEGAAQKGGW